MWLLIIEFSKKNKGKNADKAKQVEQTSVFALQMCAETTQASRGKYKETSENPEWSGRSTRLQLSPLHCAVVFCWLWVGVWGGAVDPS